MLTNEQPKMLSSEACDVFQVDYAMQVFHGVTGWHCENRATGKIVSGFPSRQAVITAYWQKYHPDWTPPVEEHDAGWALEQMRKHNLCIGTARIWQGKDLSHSVYIDLGMTTIGAIEKWMDEYDPDKPEPTREEIAENLLREVRDHIHTETRLRCDIDTFLKEADHDQ